MTDLPKSLRLDGLGLLSGRADFEAALASETDPARRPVLEFAREWCSDSPFMRLHTSGSTGDPKEILARKEHMAASAAMTVARLGLRCGDTALLALPMSYIAGQMVVVRALVAGLSLKAVTPSSRPFEGLSEPPVFTALVPMQAKVTLRHPAEAALMREVRENLLGGSSVDRDLAAAVRDFPHNVYGTYGMTETLSHVALRRLSGPKAGAWYEPLDGVELYTSPRGTLAVRAPALGVVGIETNDIVLFRPGSRRFKILGRLDNVIISGGVKVHAEMVEEAISPRVAFRFAVTGVPDPDLGSCVTIVVEGPEDTALPDFRAVMREEGLLEYCKPRFAVFVERLPETRTGKPDRNAIRNAAANPGARTRRLS